ncbi:mesoderm-specific transcript protein-like isoform X1 [Dreissena polymorpha]|nr:mesoderm-specific transcript protein-like isoform X1 [Dreissena polymorpha]XP_052266873.1 mesoderm-specific transcript protein-like isoform X1 [Dreissena polymorpha]
MGYKAMIWVVAVTAATLGYLNIPPPPLSATLKNWRKKGSVLKYKDFDIFYIVEDGFKDDGSTLLCIHGFPTSSHDYSKVLNGLKQHFEQIVLVDMLGFGFSDKPMNYDYLIKEQADIHESLLVSLNLSHAHVLSHDYGDTVALELLHRFNHNEAKFHIDSLSMLNGGVFPETNHPMVSQQLLLMPVIGPTLAHLSFYAAFKRSLARTFGPESQPTEEEMKDFYALVRNKNGNIANARLIHYITQRGENKDRWVGALQKTQVPVQMIYGPADPVNPPAFVDYYKKVVPNPRIHVLGSRVGHYPQWEDPDGVLIAYQSFLQFVSK